MEELTTGVTRDIYPMPAFVTLAVADVERTRPDRRPARPARRYAAGGTVPRVAGTPIGSVVMRFPYHQPPEPEPSPAPPEGIAPWLQERLFDRRIVLLAGRLGGTTASNVAAALVTLDAIGVDPVELHVTCVDGDLTAAFAVVDAIESMRAPVHAVVPSQVGGAALAVLAAARRRVAYAHARVTLAEPRTAMAAGTAEKVAAAAGEYLRELDELIVRLAEVTGQPRSRVEDDLSTGRVLTALQAKEYGLIDEVGGPTRGPGSPG